MLGEERNSVFNAPHLVFFPGLAIMLTVLSFNLIGDGLRDALDPRLSAARCIFPINKRARSHTPCSFDGLPNRFQVL